MSRISEPSTYISENTFLMRSFRENLVERMDSRKLKSLNALGDDFFFLVDHLSSFLFGNYKTSAALLELTQEEFHWEIQIFVNQFLRQCAESSTELLPFCRRLRETSLKLNSAVLFRIYLIKHSSIISTLPRFKIPYLPEAPFNAAF